MRKRFSAKLLVGFGLISPGLAFILFHKYLDQRKVRWFFVFLFSMYGYTMLLSGDALTHYQNFENFSDRLTWDLFIDLLGKLFSFQSMGAYGYTDPYLFLVSSFISALGLDGRYIFIITASVYGFFYINSIALALDVVKKEISTLLMVLLVLFVSWKAFNGLISIRNWTGAYILFYSILKYALEKNRKFLLIAFITPFFHFAYLFITPLVVVVYFAPKIKWFYILLFILSFSPIKSGLDYGNFLPENQLISKKADAYTADETEYHQYRKRAETIKSEQSIYKKYYREISYYGLGACIAFLILVIYFDKNVVIKGKWISLLQVAIILFSIANLVKQVIPVLSWRLFVNSGFYVFTVALYVIGSLNHKSSLKEKIFLYSGIVLLINNFYFELSLTLKSLDIKYFISPIFYPFTHMESFPLKETLKNLLGLNS